MTEVIDYVSNAVKAVFGQSPEDLTIANGYLSKYSDQTDLLINNLNGLCECNFIAEAKLQGIIPSQSVLNSIYIFSDVGTTVPTDLLEQYQVVDSDTARDTLGSFYSCVSEDDPNPILVATGSYTSSGLDLSDKQCTDWSMQGIIRISETMYAQDIEYVSYFSVTGAAPCNSFIFTKELPPTPVGYAYGICMYALYNNLPNEIVDYIDLYEA